MKIYKKILTVALLLIVAIGGVAAINFYSGQASASPRLNDYETVKKTDLIQVVAASGQVKAARDVSLSFERGGKITGVNVQTGQIVRQGQVLASLDTSDLAIQLGLAQNALDVAQIKLQQVKGANNPAGGESTEIQTAIDNGLENAANKIKEAYISTDGMMGSSVDQFFSEPKSNGPRFGFSVTQGNTTYHINAPIDTVFKLDKERRDITVSMNKWADDIGDIDQANIESAQIDAQNSLGQIQVLLTDLAGAINSYSSASASDNLVYNSYKAAIQNSRVGIDSTLVGVLTAKQVYNSSKASANPDNVKIQEIAVSNAQNQLKSIQNQIAKSSIYSPINGVLGSQNAKIGQTAIAGVALIDIFSNLNLQIDVYLPESDIAKIKVGQTAAVLLDSFPGENFGARVISIDPESQKIGAAQNYKATLEFDQDNGDIKPGMTANVSIETDARNGVVAIPIRSIIKKDGDDFVMLKTDGLKSEEREITTGIDGQDGYIEIVSGLKEGEVIINY